MVIVRGRQFDGRRSVQRSVVTAYGWANVFRGSKVSRFEEHDFCFAVQEAGAGSLHGESLKRRHQNRAQHDYGD